MRAKIILGFLFIFLLGSGQSLFAANVHHQLFFISNQNLSDGSQENFSNEDQTSTIIEDNDIDLEEEYQRNNEVNHSFAKFHFTAKNNSLKKWNSITSKNFIFTYKSHYFKIFLPFCGLSNPIYIVNRVLRI